MRRVNRIISLIYREREGRGRVIADDESWEFMLQELSGIERNVLDLMDKVEKLQRIILQADGEVRYLQQILKY